MMIKMIMIKSILIRIQIRIRITIRTICSIVKYSLRFCELGFALEKLAKILGLAIHGWIH